MEITIKDKVRKSGSGRKPIQDRSQVKVQLPIYIKQQVIDSYGGNEQIRKAIYQFLDK